MSRSAVRVCPSSATERRKFTNAGSFDGVVASGVLALDNVARSCRSSGSLPGPENFAYSVVHGDDTVASYCTTASTSYPAERLTSRSCRSDSTAALQSRGGGLTREG